MNQVLMVVLTITLITTGCISHKPTYSQVSWAEVGGENSVVQTGIVKRALCVGMGNSKIAGPCPGSDVDAKMGMMIANQMGFDTRLMENERATYDAVLSALNAMVKDIQAGSTLFLFWSGHGGQIEDMSGDENIDSLGQDDMDECLFPWDNYLLDDELADAFERVPAGVRIFFVCDTCNSGSMARNAKPVPPVSRVVSRSFKASLILFASCAEDENSFGTSFGGYFTTALLDSWYDGITYEKWFNAAVKTIPKRPNQTQKPELTTYGNVSWIKEPALK